MAGSNQDPHVGSIMLTYDMVVPLAIFALRADGASVVHWCGTTGNSTSTVRTRGRPREVGVGIRAWDLERIESSVSNDYGRDQHGRTDKVIK